MIHALLLAASISTCVIENARYELRGAPGVTASFEPVRSTVDWPAGLALRVSVAKSGRSYWFLPWQGGTDGRTNLAWVREAGSPIQIQSVRRDMEFFATDAAYNLSPGTPRAGGPAPTHLLLPDLPDLAWHSTTDSNRDGLPRAFFDLRGCSGHGKARYVPRIDFPPVP